MYDSRYNDTGNGPGDFWRGSWSRRDFLRNAAILAGGSFVALACGPQAAATLAPTLAPAATQASPAAAEAGVTISPDDPRIEAGHVVFPSNGNTLLGYLSRPKGDGPHPAVLVVHENRGLLPHFPDVTRRLAVEGYAALAVDLLSRVGGTGSFAGPDEMRTALRSIPRDKFVKDSNAGVAYLQSQPFVRSDRVGAMGFCFGGSIVWLMAVRNPGLRAAVPFYGSAPPLEEVRNMQVPVLGIYAALDNRINAGVPNLEKALQDNGKTHKFVTYPGANHAFFNDTGGRYHPEAANGAWKETLGWFEAHLMN